MSEPYVRRRGRIATTKDVSAHFWPPSGPQCCTTVEGLLGQRHHRHREKTMRDRLHLEALWCTLHSWNISRLCEREDEGLAVLFSSLGG